jgi:cell division protein ZapA (FtsZ GTPase activity inhibitor)
MCPEDKEIYISIAGGHYPIKTANVELLNKAVGLLEGKVEEFNNSSKIVNTHRAVVMAGLKVAVGNIEQTELLTQAEAIVDRLSTKLDEIDI